MIQIFLRFMQPIIFAALFGAAAFAVAQDEAQSREEKLRELKASIEMLKQELEKIKDNRSGLLGDLETTEQKMGELNKKVQELKEVLQDNQAKLHSLQSERRELFSAKKRQTGQVGEHVNAAYRLGHQSSIKLLLNQNDPTKVARNLKYFDYVIKARAEKIQAFENTINKINKIEPEIAYKQTLLKQTSNKLNSQFDELASAQSQRRRTLKKLESLIDTKDKELAAKETDRRNLEKLVSQVIRVMGELDLAIDVKRLPQKKGYLPWPVNGKVRHRFGSYRIAGKLRWEGIVISAGEGTPVRAIHHGRIVYSDYLRGHGLLVIIDHGGEYLSLYGHNQALFKSVGEWVDAGDTIATVGDSGGAKQAGLYFELRYKSKPTNPQGWLAKSS